MKTNTLWMIGTMAGLAAVSAQVIDTSETRVQTTLDPGPKRTGTIKPRSVGQIAGQNSSLGCEKVVFKVIPVYDAPTFIADEDVLMKQRAAKLP